MRQPMLTGNESFAPVAPTMTRRSVLQQTGLGIGSLALSHLVQQDRARGAGSGSFDLQPKPGHFPAQAKSVIMLLMNGGPSQVDSFDPKPRLEKDHGKPFPMGLPCCARKCDWSIPKAARLASGTSTIPNLGRTFSRTSCRLVVLLKCSLLVERHLV